MSHTGPLTLADSCISPRRASHPPPICESPLSISAPVLLPPSSFLIRSIFTAISIRRPAVARERAKADRVGCHAPLPIGAANLGLVFVSWRDSPFSSTVRKLQDF